MKVPKGKYIDHLNRDKLDNRKENLRIVSMSENLLNAKLFKTSTTKRKGVYFNRQRNKFQTYMTRNYKHIYLGSFNTADQAALAYANAT